MYYNYSRSNSGGRSRASGSMPKKSKVGYMVLGLLLSAPFVINMVGPSTYNLTLFQILGVIGVLVGGPMFFIGWFGANDGTPSASTVDLDVARIRFAAEQEMMRKK